MPKPSVLSMTPSIEQTTRMRKISALGEEFLNKILDISPGSREQALAITKLEECVMWANKAVSREDASKA